MQKSQENHNSCRLYPRHQSQSCCSRPQLIVASPGTMSPCASSRYPSCELPSRRDRKHLQVSGIPSPLHANGGLPSNDPAYPWSMQNPCLTLIVDTYGLRKAHVSRDLGNAFCKRNCVSHSMQVAFRYDMLHPGRLTSACSSIHIPCFCSCTWDRGSDMAGPGRLRHRTLTVKSHSDVRVQPRQELRSLRCPIPGDGQGLRLAALQSSRSIVGQWDLRDPHVAKPSLVEIECADAQTLCQGRRKNSKSSELEPRRTCSRGQGRGHCGRDS